MHRIAHRCDIRRRERHQRRRRAVLCARARLVRRLRRHDATHHHTRRVASPRAHHAHPSCRARVGARRIQPRQSAAHRPRVPPGAPSRRPPRVRALRHVYVSPLLRARQTAAPILEAQRRGEVIENWLEEIRSPIWQATRPKRPRRRTAKRSSATLSTAGAASKAAKR